MVMSPYDFIVVGGGTAGLAVANRLSEDPSQRILVLEAGSDISAEPRVTIPASWGSLLGSDADWGFQTEAQPTLNGRSISVNQGKALGGSSTINAQVFVPPVPSVIDAWKTLGNAGWNWDSFHPYFAKSFTTPPPVNETLAKELGIDGWTATSAPSNGPLKVSFPGNPSHPVRKAWADSFRANGYYMPEDPFLDATVGSFSCLASVDPEKKERSDATSAYYNPIKSRENLHILTNAVVEKILFKGEGSSTTATGVQYNYNNESRTATSSKDVILAAGALQSPKILELSGIGNSKLLAENGIKLVADLPGVGENLQDHIMGTISYVANDDLETIDPILRQEPAALERAGQEYAANRTGPLTSMGVYTFAYLPVIDYLSEEGRTTLEKLLAENRPSTGSDSSGDQARAQAYYEIAEKALLDPKEPSAAYLSYIGQNTGTNENNTKSLSFNVILSHPVSRGSVHIGSNQVSTAPVVNPNYLSSPVDHEVFAHHMLYIETIAASSPLNSLLKTPLTHRVPASELTDLQTAKEWIQQNAVSMWHVGGSCAMLPKEINGVVNSNLEVYGVKNLRIVDSSAIPLISTANLQSTVYAFAERAADIIKGAWKLQ
ncbi:putative GMC oxidoreductase [Biscogniauxia marginata]|nr:putative GMC oxidoreductase [Biscogniauxia marginata]